MLETIFNSPHDVNWMFTATYPNTHPRDGLIAKYHLHTFLAWLRKYLKTNYHLRLIYLWVQEFQTRGAIHFHILISGIDELGFSTKVVKRHHTLPMQSEEYETIPRLERTLRRRWLEIIAEEIPALGWYGISDNDYLAKERAHGLGAGDCLERLDNPAAYFAKKEMVNSKEYQRTTPPDYINTGRWWGASRDFKQPFSDYELYEISESKLRALLYLAGWQWLDIFDHLPKYLFGLAPILKRLIRDHGIPQLSIPLEKAKAAVRSIFHRNLKGIRSADDFSISVSAAKIYNREQNLHDRRHYNVHINMPRLPRRALRPPPNAPPEDPQPPLF